MIKRYLSQLVTTAVASLLFAVQGISVAGEELPDRLGVSLGAFSIDSIDVTAAAVPSNTVIPVGAIINLDRNLGVDDSDDSFRLDGYYRFSQRHQIDWSYYKLKVTGEQIVDESFEWDGQQYEAGMLIGSFWETETYKLGYLYSFHRDKKVELGVGGGLHVTDLALGLDLLAEAQGSTLPQEFRRSAVLDATAPVPYVSFLVKYNMSRRWSFSLKYDALRLSFEDISGIMTDSLLSIEHHTFKHVGFGLGYNAFRIEVDDSNGDTDYIYQSKYEGILLYMKAYL